MECIDVFSGIGGIALALKPYVKTTLYCEIEPYCQYVLAERMTEGLIEKAPIHADIQTLCLPDYYKPSIICGGFPCQDISSMGLQKGIVSSERSSLFFEILRVVDQCPSIHYVFLENVANITNCGMKDVIDGLVSREFDMQWMTLSASSQGAPHVRNRWFCFASRTKDHSLLKSVLENTDNFSHNWDIEPCPRVTLRPSVQQDDSFDELWIQRCQTLGNSVVPTVVRNAFLSLANTSLNWQAIYQGLQSYSKSYETLNYPFADYGLIVDKHYISLPKLETPVKQHNLSINVTHDDKTLKLNSYPTPRRGITHPSSLTDRSMRDLPAILVNCVESQNYLNDLNITLSEKLHTQVLPNVNYIEWMMGFPANWTKVSKFKKSKKQTPEAPTESPEENTPQTTTNVSEVTRPRYNGMHLFMKDFPGKDIKQVATAWKALSDEKRKEYSLLAKQYNP